MLAYFEYSQLTIEDKKKLVLRNSDSDHQIQKQVAEIIAEVRENGDRALISYAEKFDKVSLKSLIINEDELNQQARSEEHTSDLKSLMRTSYAVFYLKQKQNLTILEITMVDMSTQHIT